jgi:hypothetical protein
MNRHEFIVGATALAIAPVAIAPSGAPDFSRPRPPTPGFEQVDMSGYADWPYEAAALGGQDGARRGDRPSDARWRNEFINVIRPKQRELDLSRKSSR